LYLSYILHLSYSALLLYSAPLILCTSPSSCISFSFLLLPFYPHPLGILLPIFAQRTRTIAAFPFTFACTFTCTCTCTCTFTFTFLFTSFFSFLLLFLRFYPSLSSGLLPASFQIVVEVLAVVGSPCESFIAS
jgi:hypothetical protein